MKKILLFFVAINTIILAEETVLVPLENGEYERVPITDIMNNNVIQYLDKSLDKSLDLKKEITPSYVVQNHKKFIRESFLTDNFSISMKYKEKTFDKKSLEDNRNYYQNRVADIFLDNSKIKKNIYQDEYFFNLSLFNYLNDYEKYNSEMKNKGIVFETQYGLTDEWAAKFNLGYMNSEIDKNKSKDFYLGIDINYNSRSVIDEIEYNYGTRLGYLNSKHIKEYKVDDMFVGLLYYNMNIPLTTDLSSQIGYETSIISNKLNLGLNQNIWINNDVELNIILDGNYIFGYNDKHKNIYTHLDENKPGVTAKINMKWKALEITPSYEFINKNIGIEFTYSF